MVLCFYLIDNGNHLKQTRKDYLFLLPYPFNCLKEHTISGRTNPVSKIETILWIYKMISIEEWSRPWPHAHHVHRAAASGEDELLVVSSSGPTDEQDLLRKDRKTQSQTAHNSLCTVHTIQWKQKEEFQRHNAFHPYHHLTAVGPR